jgi:hypothetical protein
VSAMTCRFDPDHEDKLIVFISMENIKIFEKLNEQKGKALGKKMDEIDALLKPYTITLANGMEEVTIPDAEVALKYEKLHKEFQEIVNEINLIDKN